MLLALNKVLGHLRMPDTLYATVFTLDIQVEEYLDNSLTRLGKTWISNGALWAAEVSAELILDARVAKKSFAFMAHLRLESYFLTESTTDKLLYFFSPGPICKLLAKQTILLVLTIRTRGVALKA